MPRGYHLDRQDVLLALYGYFITADEGHHVSSADLRQETKLLLSTSYTALLLESLQDGKLVDGDIDGDDIDTYTLTEAGILQAEKLIIGRGQTLNEFEVSFRAMQSSGLVVDLAHPELDQAKAVLEELEQHLRQDNDVGRLTPDDREIAINEVSELRDTLSKPRARTHYIWAKANEALMWLIEKGASSVVGELAKRALGHVHNFINVFFN